MFSANYAAVLRRWLDAVQAGDPTLPVSQRLFTEVFAMETRTGDWGLMSWNDEAARWFFDNIPAYFAEWRDFIAREFGTVLPDSDFDALVETQQAVMPRVARTYPIRVTLPHNVKAYFDQVKAVPSLDRLDGAAKNPADARSDNPAIRERVVRVDANFDGGFGTERLVLARLMYGRAESAK